MNANPTEDGYLLRLRREVEQEIHSYVYEVPDDAIGDRMTTWRLQMALRECEGLSSTHIGLKLRLGTHLIKSE